MGQNPNDPKVKAYYTAQRKRDEMGALRGDAQSAQELGRIAGKLGKRRGARDRVIASRGAGDRAVPVNVQDDPIAYLPDVAFGIAKGAASLAGRGIRAAAAHLFPEASDMAGGSLAKALRRPMRASGARVERPALPRKASSPMKNVTPKSKPGSFARQAKATARKQTSIAKQAKARAGGKNKTPIAVPPKVKALPKGKPLGADYKDADKVGKGGTPRMTQQSPRAKSANPRQQPGYTRKKRNRGA